MLRERIPPRELPTIFPAYAEEPNISFTPPKFVDTTERSGESAPRGRKFYRPAFYDISSKKELRVYEEDSIIYQEDETALDSMVYGVKEGLVLLERREIHPRNPALEHSSVTFVARPGDIFGVEDIVFGYHLTTARALVSSEVASVERKPNSENVPWFYKEINRRIQDSEEQQSLYKPGFSLERTAYALAELSEVADDIHIVRYSHETIAYVAGCWRETISHKVERLGEKGIIYQSGECSLEIPDIQKLVDATGLYQKKRVTPQRYPVVSSPKFLQEPTDIRYQDHSGLRARRTHEGRRKLNS